MCADATRTLRPVKFRGDLEFAQTLQDRPDLDHVKTELDWTEGTLGSDRAPLGVGVEPGR